MLYGICSPTETQMRTHLNALNGPDPCREFFFRLALGCLFFLPAAVPAKARINGTPGSPSATTW
jgi:hypothetical protein